MLRDTSVSAQGQASVDARSRVGVDDDVSRLASVVLHRPGAELAAVRDAPSAWLFSGAPDVDEAQREHDVLAGLLHARGTEVTYLEDLVVDVLERPATRRAFIELALRGSPDEVRRRVAELAPRRAARALIGGLPAGDVHLPALPNLVYTRDSSVWIGSHAVAATMATAARRREGPLLDALHRLHPRFAPATVGAPRGPALEGGDVLVAGSGRVLIGVSERTRHGGALSLATWLLAGGAADEVLTVELPPGAGFHLDLVLTMVDHDTYAVWAPVRRQLRGHRWHRRRNGLIGGSAAGDVLAGARVIELDGGDARVHGRAWDHGTNVLTIAPGVVIAYADNARANDRLQSAGIEVLPFAAPHLAAGRGGPRCLTCPVGRAGEDPASSAGPPSLVARRPRATADRLTSPY